MSKPVTTTAGSIIIPEADFNAWVLSLISPSTGTFVTLGKVKIKPEGDLEVKFTTSTAEQPPTPVEVDLRPA